MSKIYHTSVRLIFIKNRTKTDLYYYIMETEPPSHFQIWLKKSFYLRLTFLEMVAILVCLANNMIKLYGMKTKSLKFWFLVTVSGSGALRGISLLVIMEQPSGAWLDFLYTAPTLLWIQSFIIFIGHLVICYQVLANKDSNFVHQCICYSPLCLGRLGILISIIIFLFLH